MLISFILKFAIKALTSTNDESLDESLSVSKDVIVSREAQVIYSQLFAPFIRFRCIIAHHKLFCIFRNRTCSVCTPRRCSFWAIRKRMKLRNVFKMFSNTSTCNRFANCEFILCMSCNRLTRKTIYFGFLNSVQQRHGCARKRPTTDQKAEIFVLQELGQLALERWGVGRGAWLLCEGITNTVYCISPDYVFKFEYFSRRVSKWTAQSSWFGSTSHDLPSACKTITCPSLPPCRFAYTVHRLHVCVTRKLNPTCDFRDSNWTQTAGSVSTGSLL